MRVHPEGDSGKFRLVGLGPGSFKVSETKDSITVTPQDFGTILAKADAKQKFFDEIFLLIDDGKEITVTFGSPNARTNFFAVELSSSDTVDLFSMEYGLEVELQKDTETGPASSVTIKKIGLSKSDFSGPSSDDLLTGSHPPAFVEFNPDESDSGGLLDADNDRGGNSGFLEIPWDSSSASSYSGGKDSNPSFFEEHFLDTSETANFNRVNIMPSVGDFVLDRSLNSLFAQVVKHKRVINIPQDTSVQRYDPKGLFTYLNKKTNEVHIILNGRNNINNEMIQDTIIAPIVVHFLKNGHVVALNYGFEDASVLNYEMQTGNLFSTIESKYNVETGLSITCKVEERENAKTMFTFAVLQSAA